MQWHCDVPELGQLVGVGVTVTITVVVMVTILRLLFLCIKQKIIAAYQQIALNRYYT